MLLSFISVPRQCVVHFKSEGGSVLLSFISLLSNHQRQCVVQFESESHRGAWGDCVVVSQLFSTSACHSFQKSGSPVGLLVSACLQCLFGGLPLFTLNFEWIINLFNFFRSSMAYTHVSIFEWVGFEPGALRVRV